MLMTAMWAGEPDLVRPDPLYPNSGPSGLGRPFGLLDVSAGVTAPEALQFGRVARCSPRPCRWATCRCTATTIIGGSARWWTRTERWCRRFATPPGRPRPPPTRTAARGPDSDTDH